MYFWWLAKRLHEMVIIIIIIIIMHYIFIVALHHKWKHPRSYTIKITQITESNYHKKVWYSEYTDGHLQHGEDNLYNLEQFLAYWGKWVTHVTPHRPDFIFINQWMYNRTVM